MCEPEDPTPDGDISHNTRTKTQTRPAQFLHRFVVTIKAEPVTKYKITNVDTCTAPCGEVPSCSGNQNTWSVTASWKFMSVTVSGGGNGANSPSGLTPSPCKKIIVKKGEQRAVTHTLFTMTQQPQKQDYEHGPWYDYGTPDIETNKQTSGSKLDGYKFTNCGTYCEKQ
jgi:hypothetical protein